MSIFSKVFGAIWGVIKGLFESTQTEFNKLPKEQQDAILNGVQVSQIIKDNIDRGETYVIDVIASRLNLSQDVAKGLFGRLSNDLGVTSVLQGVADKIGQGITDLAHNALFQLIAQSAAAFLSGGTVNWLTLALGVVEYAYQFLKGNDKLIQPINTAADTPILLAGGKTDCPQGQYWNGTRCVKDVG